MINNMLNFEQVCLEQTCSKQTCSKRFCKKLDCNKLLSPHIFISIYVRG